MNISYLHISAVFFGILSGTSESDSLVYAPKWEKPGEPGPEWETARVIQISPNGKRTFLAGLRDKTGTARLRLKNLPEHQFLTIEFDLILRGTWDGSHAQYGPDYITLSLDEDRTLMDATFLLFDNHEGGQSFPYDRESGLSTPLGTGMSESATLGYWDNRPEEHRRGDGVIPVKFTVPHSDKGAVLEWSGSGHHDGLEAQWYGLDKVKVSVATKATDYSDEEWSVLVSQLEGDDPVTAWNASWQMLRAPERVTDYLAKAPDVMDPVTLDKLMDDLVDEEFKVRQTAAERLMGLPRSVLPQFKAARLVQDDPEAKALLKRIIESIENSESNADPLSYWREHLKAQLSAAEPQGD